MSPGILRIWPSMPVLRTILAALALASQLALGPLPARTRLAADAMAGLRAVAVLCDASAYVETPGRAIPAAPHRQRAPDDGTGCRLELALELPAIVMPPAIALPRPLAAIAARSPRRPPVRAPPARATAGPPARAPPDLA